MLILALPGPECSKSAAILYVNLGACKIENIGECDRMTCYMLGDTP